MRLHLNENTAGCSPAASRRCGASDVRRRVLSDYDTALDAVARLFGVPADHLVPTNGMDEGILAAAAARVPRPLQRSP